MKDLAGNKVRVNSLGPPKYTSGVSPEIPNPDPPLKLGPNLLKSWCLWPHVPLRRLLEVYQPVVRCGTSSIHVHFPAPLSFNHIGHGCFCERRGPEMRFNYQILPEMLRFLPICFQNKSVICLLHIASASLLCIEHCAIQTATTMWAQATSSRKVSA